jgi:hypothetical protein
MLAPGALQAQAARAGASVAPPIPVVPHGFLGYTFCRSGLAESWVRADVVGTPQADEVLAHESVHREQAATFPDCEAWQASLVSAAVMEEIPAPARGAARLAAARPDSLRWSCVSRRRPGRSRTGWTCGDVPSGEVVGSGAGNTAPCEDAQRSNPDERGSRRDCPRVAALLAMTRPPQRPRPAVSAAASVVHAR